MPNTQFQFRYVLLTYAQCGGLDPFEIVNHLAQLGAECIIGRENHSDGGIHLHAFADFGRKFRTRDQRCFDVGGRHPNIESCKKTPEKMYDYAIKDGDVVAGGLERPSGNGVLEASSKWHDIIMATTRDEFFDRVAMLDPRALCVNFSSLRCYADWKYREDPTPYATPSNIQFDVSGFPELDDWVRGNLEGHSVEGEYTLRTAKGHILC